MGAHNQKIVLLFGAFDPLHEGHRDCFLQAKAVADRLFVVVASDAQIRFQKKHEPLLGQSERLDAVKQEKLVDEVILGEENIGEYRLLTEIPFDVLAVGYDQEPDDAGIRKLLQRIGKADKEFVRLKPYKPEIYKSSLFKGLQ